MRCKELLKFLLIWSVPQHHVALLSVDTRQPSVHELRPRRLIWWISKFDVIPHGGQRRGKMSRKDPANIRIKDIITILTKPWNKVNCSERYYINNCVNTMKTTTCRWSQHKAFINNAACFLLDVSMWFHMILRIFLWTISRTFNPPVLDKAHPVRILFIIPKLREGFSCMLLRTPKNGNI